METIIEDTTIDSSRRFNDWLVLSKPTDRKRKKPFVNPESVRAENLAVLLPPYRLKPEHQIA
jgi:hypothetical protein